ncbi:MAG: sugar phosphate isomerase/epimerase family protein [Candidatus Thorarchaeota archaeon]
MAFTSLGFSTICLGNTPAEEVIELARRLDFDHVEIPYEAPFLMYSGENIYRAAEIVKELLATYGLSNTLHAPQKDLNFSSYHFEVQELSIVLTKRAIDVASLLKSSLVTLHCGKSPFNQNPTPTDIRLVKSAINECLRYANKQNIKLAIENAEYEPKNLCKSLNEIQDLLSDFPILLMTLDTSHCLDHKLDASEIGNFVHNFRNRIRNVHLSLTSHSPLNYDSHFALNLLNNIVPELENDVFITLELHDRMIKNPVSETLSTDKSLVKEVLKKLGKI